MPVLSDEDRRFLAELFRQHQWMMYRTVFPMLQNPWDTEDVIQSVAVKLTDKLPLLRSLEGPRLTAYLAAACRNTALNHRRETQRRAEYPYSEELGCPGQSLAAQNLLPEMEDRFLALRQAWKGLEAGCSTDSGKRPLSQSMPISAAPLTMAWLMSSDGTEWMTSCIWGASCKIALMMGCMT